MLKKAEEEKRTIVFVDGPSFYLLLMGVRTYALCGQTLVLRLKLTRNHLSAIDTLFSHLSNAHVAHDSRT